MNNRYMSNNIERNAYRVESEFFRNSKEILRKPELTIALRMYYDKRAKVFNFCPFAIAMHS